MVFGHKVMQDIHTMLTSPHSCFELVVINSVTALIKTKSKNASSPTDKTMLQLPFILQSLFHVQFEAMQDTYMSRMG